MRMRLFFSLALAPMRFRRMKRFTHKDDGDEDDWDAQSSQADAQMLTNEEGKVSHGGHGGHGGEWH